MPVATEDERTRRHRNEQYAVETHHKTHGEPGIPGHRSMHCVLCEEHAVEGIGCVRRHRSEEGKRESE